MYSLTVYVGSAWADASFKEAKRDSFIQIGFLSLKGNYTEVSVRGNLAAMLYKMFCFNRFLGP